MTSELHRTLQTRQRRKRKLIRRVIRELIDDYDEELEMEPRS